MRTGCTHFELHAAEFVEDVAELVADDRPGDLRLALRRALDRVTRHVVKPNDVPQHPHRLVERAEPGGGNARVKQYYKGRTWGGNARVKQYYRGRTWGGNATHELNNITRAEPGGATHELNNITGAEPGGATHELNNITGAEPGGATHELNNITGAEHGGGNARIKQYYRGRTWGGQRTS